MDPVPDPAPDLDPDPTPDLDPDPTPFSIDLKYAKKIVFSIFFSHNLPTGASFQSKKLIFC